MRDVRNGNFSPAPEGVIADGAEPVMISDQFKFTEGPAADAHGNVFFTDQPNNKIWKYSTDGQLSVFMENAGRSNGMYFDTLGDLFTCADAKNEIWRISPAGKVNVILQALDGKRLNGPNDLWISKSGRIYFTDPYYQRDYWERTKPEMESEDVYLMDGVNSKPEVIESDLKKPNGIIGTPDGTRLYVADIGGNKTYSYDVLPNGRLSNKALFTEKGSDGMTLDDRGNLYLTGNGVTVFDPAGKQIAHIPIPQKWTANVCFGGAENNMLFITASSAVYTLQMNVRGAR